MIRPIFLLIFSFFLTACNPLKRAAIKIDSYPTAKVYLDGKEAGSTPYENRSLSSGNVEVKLINDENTSQVWTKIIRLQNNINTTVRWNFGDTDEQSSGFILYAEKTGEEKKVGLLVNTSPDKSAIQIDNVIKGFSPIRFDDIGLGDKSIHLSFPGYKDVDISTREIKGYQLVIDASLGKETITVVDNSLSPTPTPSLAVTQNLVVIKSTPTGWLRVRKSNDTSSAEIAKVKPGQQFKILETSTDWIKIDLENDLSGWVSSKYVDRL